MRVANLTKYRNLSPIMLLNKDAFDELASRVGEFEGGRSSFWRDEQDVFKFDEKSFSGVGPLGTFSTSSGVIPAVAHFVLQLPYRLNGLRFKYFSSICRAARVIARKQSRQFDLDLLRHVLTLAFLRRHLGTRISQGPICIIGDGYANMASVILATMPESKVIVVNLNTTLLVDLICLRTAFPETDYVLVRTESELDEALASDIRIIAIGANEASILRGKRLALSINIESMMEMDAPVIEDYFNIIRSAPGEYATFYCCNQESKRYSADGTSNFYEYPWRDDDRILVDEICTWTKIRYGNTVPFYSRRKPDLHRLVDLKTSS
jgi:hypothetical protein